MDLVIWRSAEAASAGAGHINPSVAAFKVAAARVVHPSFFRMFSTCVRTVPGPMPKDLRFERHLPRGPASEVATRTPVGEGFEHAAERLADLRRGAISVAIWTATSQ